MPPLPTATDAAPSSSSPSTNAAAETTSASAPDQKRSSGGLITRALLVLLLLLTVAFLGSERWAGGGAGTDPTGLLSRVFLPPAHHGSPAPPPRAAPRHCTTVYTDVLVAAAEAREWAYLVTGGDSVPASVAAGLAPLREVLTVAAVSHSSDLMALNYLEGLRRNVPSLLVPLLVVAYSRSTLRRMRRFNAVAQAEGSPCVFVYDGVKDLRPDVADAVEQEQNARYSGATFRVSAWERYMQVSRLVGANFTVFMTDVDMAVFRDPRPYLFPLVQEEDTLYGACESAWVTTELNTGAIMMGPRQAAVLKFWMEQAGLDHGGTRTEQYVVNRLGPPMQRRCLPPDLLHVRCVGTKPQPDIQLVHHYNCIESALGKVEAMRNDGFWYLTPEQEAEGGEGGEE
jgi:hypothetical protein